MIDVEGAHCQGDRREVRVQFAIVHPVGEAVFTDPTRLWRIADATVEVICQHAVCRLHHDRDAERIAIHIAT
ncbi:hypothetical protein D3C79_1101010 [compost metagenome]